jgi:DNA-binding transcriptional LysR family regulator
MVARASGWQDLTYFLAVARGGTLASAAATLSVNPSTVHRRIAALERSVGTRLFDRSPRGYAPTDAGADLLSHALEIESAVMRAERELSGRDDSLAGTVRLATVDDLALSVLGTILGEFRERHPSIRLEVSIDATPVDMGRRQADVAIRPGQEPQDRNLIARRVCRVDSALYGSRSYLSRRPPPATIDDLGEHPIVRADESRRHLPMERYVDRYAPADRTAFRSNSMLARLGAVRDAVGLGMLPCFIADREPELVRIGPVRPEAAAGLWVLCHADLRRNAKVRALVDFTYQGLVRQRERFEAR